MHFRRRRPRKQPRSVMSSSERIFTERRPKDEPAPDVAPRAKKRRRPRKRVHGVERRYPWLLRAGWREWRLWKWYDTEAQRDQALAGLLKRGRHRTIGPPDGGPAFRAVDRPR